MAAGRKPLSNRIKRLRGNPGGRPLNAEASLPALLEVPRPPRHLGKRAAALWRQIAREYVSAGMITALDKPLLAALCSAWASYVEAESRLNREGLTLETPHGRKANPLVRVRDSSLTLLKGLSAEFGASPSSRSRISVPEKPEPESDFQKFMRGDREHDANWKPPQNRGVQQ